MVAPRDRTGERYGRLVALRRVGSTKWGQATWECLCDCGNTTVTVGTKLGRDTHSCGCLFMERVTELGRQGVLPVVKYGSAHSRVRRSRGSARTYSCADCDGPASDWSYNKNDPDELVGVIELSDGRRVEAAYSVDPKFYSPRCRSCHVKFDAKPSAA